MHGKEGAEARPGVGYIRGCREAGGRRSRGDCTAAYTGSKRVGPDLEWGMSEGVAKRAGVGDRVIGRQLADDHVKDAGLLARMQPHTARIIHHHLLRPPFAII